MKKRNPKRKFTEAAKRKLLKESDAITKWGTKGAWLAKHGLTFSLLTHWRKELGVKRSVA